MNIESIHVLLIEDNPGDARLIREMLASVNTTRFDLECAERLSDGLARLGAGGIDAVLLDLSLPDSQGADTFARMHAHAPRVPIVVMTGHEDEALGVQMVEAGAQEYLVKGQVASALLARAIRYAIERQRAEETLRGSENRFRSLIENASDLILILNLDHTIAYVSPSIERILGHTVAAVIGARLTDFVDPQALPDLIAAIEHRARTPGPSPFLMELCVRHADGSWRIMEGIGSNLLDQPGVSGLVINARDITERKRAEGEIRDSRDAVLNMLEDLDKTARQVQASEEQYRTLVENATEFIWTLDTEGRYTFVNRVALEVGGIKAEDLLGQHFALLIVPEDLPRVQRTFEETLAGKKQSYETRAFHTDGHVMHLSVNTAPLYAGSKVIGIISFGRDVTAQKKAEAALQQRMTELTALFEVSGALRGVEGVERMLPIIVGKAIESCRADCGSVLLLDESGETLVCRYGTGARQNLVGARLRLGQGISGRVAQGGAAHLSPDFQHDPLLAFGPATSARLPEIASDVCVPLRVGEQIVGAMHISTYTARTCTEAELRLLTAIADMAASAIRRAGLLEQLEHRVHELSTLFDVGKMVTASLRIEDVLDFIVRAATRVFNAEGCYLMLWDEREQRLVLRAVVGLPSIDVGRVKYRPGEGLAGLVFLEGKTINATDLDGDPRWKHESQSEATLASAKAINSLVVSLKMGDKTLGVLGVINKIGAPAFAIGDESLLTTLAGQAAISIENARLYEDVRQFSIATIRSLAAAIDARDPYTRGHSEGVTQLAVQLAQQLGWSGADLETIEFAALLHDVGKIGVPDAILRKTEALTPDEWDIIRRHPYFSAKIVEPVGALQRIIPWIYHHHERWDGKGYLDGLKGEDIPLGARIIAIADSFDAMTTDRPYRKALAMADALAEIERCSSAQFDPQLAKIFLELIASKDHKGDGQMAGD